MHCAYSWPTRLNSRGPIVMQMRSRLSDGGCFEGFSGYVAPSCCALVGRLRSRRPALCIATVGGVAGLPCRCIEAAEWFWNHHFSAVAGDAVGFESIPPRLPDGSFGTTSDFGMCSRFFKILSTRSLTWELYFSPYSSAPILPIILRTAYRRALGLESPGRALQGSWALYIPAH